MGSWRDRRGRRLFRFYGFLQSLDRWFSRRFTTLGRMAMWAMIITGLFALDTRRSQAYQLFAVLVVLLVIAWVSTRWRRPPAVSLSRLLPGYATAGEPFSYRVKVQTPGLNGREIWLRDVLSGPQPDAVQFRRLREPNASRRGWFYRRAGFTRWVWLSRRSRGADTIGATLVATTKEDSVTMNLWPLRRGYLHFTAMEVGATEPLGICRRTGVVKLGGQLLVLPRRFSVAKPIFPGGGQTGALGGGLVAMPGQSDEFLGLREYRPGDPVKHIHWKRFASLGEPIVREFCQQASQRVAVVLDGYGALNGEPRLETAVEVAASVAEHAHLADGAVDLILADCMTSSAGPAAVGLDGLLAKLACADGTLQRDAHAIAQRVMSAQQQVRGIVYVLVEWDDASLDMVRNWVGCGLAVSVIVVGPDDMPEVSLQQLPDGAKVRFTTAGHARRDLSA